MWTIICLGFLPCLPVLDHLGFSGVGGGEEANCGGPAANSQSVCKAKGNSDWLHIVVPKC
jgi:hypothetical protein